MIRGVQVLKTGLKRETLYKFCNIASSMSIKEAAKGKSLREVVSVLHSFAAPSLAASWDNVGLILEPTEPKCVNRILLTNDLTEEVVEESVDSKIDLIVSYHPPIFAPLKSVTTRTWKVLVTSPCVVFSDIFSSETC